MLDGLPALGVVSALAAGLAVALLVGPSAAVLSRTRERRAAGPPVWLTGRPDAVGTLPRRLLVGVLAGTAVALAGVDAVGPWAVALGPVVALGAAAGLGWLEPIHVRRRRWQVTLEAPQVLELLAAALAAGRPLRTAAAAVVRACPGPTADDLGQVLRQVELGTGDVDAWRSLSRHPQLGRAAADLARSVESGTGLVETLVVHAAEARDERRGAIDAQARTVGVRSVLPLMVCFLPSFLLLGIVPTLVSAISNALRF